MQNIIGQQRIMSMLNAYTIQSLPKTLLFVGQHGCGKHTIAKYLANKFNFDFVELDETVTAENLIEYSHSTINTLYLIDLNKFSEKQQNQFLKFIEEPTKTVYVVLLASSDAVALNTIINRCAKYSFDAYSKEEVEQITNTTINDLAFAIFKTPGKLLNLTGSSFDMIFAAAKDVVYNTGSKTLPTALALSTKINYKDLYDKIDFNLFFDAVEYVAFEDYKNTGNAKSLKVFFTTNTFKHYAAQQSLIKETLMLNYLITLWEAMQ